MKKFIAIVVGAVVLNASAVCSRERGQELLARFAQGISGSVVTNKGECVCTELGEGGEYKYFSLQDKGGLRCVRISRNDGGVDIYKYREGRLDSASCTTTNRMDMVATIFVGDGVSTGTVDRIEFDVVGGKLAGQMRLLDSEGRRIVRPMLPATERSSFDKEYIPKPGSTGRIGPYEWTIVGPGRVGVLSRNGQKILEGRFAIGGKYPWIVGRGGEKSESANRKELSDKGIVPLDKYSGVNYLFAIDMRNDHVEYFSENNKDEFERVTGQSWKSYDRYGFWAYFLSKRGPDRLASLESAMKPPAE